MQVKEERADVGVIVGRFQTPDLHAGHHDLLRSVKDRHQKVIVFLGCKSSVKLTQKDPLDFMTRQRMIQKEYPDVVVLPITDTPSNDIWSRQLDTKIGEITDGLSVILYGSRDSFIQHYSGRHRTVQLQASVNLAASDVRSMTSQTVGDESSFRKGVIYAAFNRWPVSYQAVDMACVRNRLGNTPSLLLGRKNSDTPGLWRFPGGFVEPRKDQSLEYAAARELSEEVPGMSVHVPGVYIGSQLVNDWRYRGEQDSIMTALFRFDYLSGDVEPGDDLAATEWFDLNDVAELRNIILPGHAPLLEMLLTHLHRS